MRSTSDRRRLYLSSLWSAQPQKRYINGKAATNVKDCKESGKGSNWRVQTLESLIALSHSLRALKATKTRTNRIHHGHAEESIIDLHRPIQICNINLHCKCAEIHVTVRIGLYIGLYSLRKLWIRVSCIY